MKPAVVVLALLVLSGCSGGSPQGTPAPGDQAPTRTDVPWEDYPTDLQRIIDEDEAAKDCAGLQDIFDVQDASNQSMIDAKGHGNAKVMMYVQEALEHADCL